MNNVISRFIQFSYERFEPISHLAMISLYVLGHISLSDFSPLNSTVIFLFTLSFFYKLRLFDEIKDYEIDLKVNPTRPLPRGLVTIKEVKIASIVTYLFEGVLFYYLTSNFFTLLILWAYTILMYKEFLLKSVIRPLLTTYGLLHTLVMFFLSFTIFEMMNLDISIPKAFYFSFASWCCFNIFEVGRKTYSKEEERKNVKTYSNTWGIPGALFLCFSQVLGVSLSYSLFNESYFLFPIIIFILISIGFLYKRDSKNAKIYRIGTSIFIIFYYLLITIIQYKGLSFDLS